MADFLSNLPPIGRSPRSHSVPNTPRPSGHGHGMNAKSPRYHTPSPSPRFYETSRPSSSESSHLSSNCFSRRPAATAFGHGSYDYCILRAPVRPGRPASAWSQKLPSLRTKNNEDVISRYTNHYRSQSAADIYRTSSEECLKCMLKVPHSKCVGHKYIRVGGGYRHSYWYLKSMLDEIEARQFEELLRRQRLEAIEEKTVRAIKTYIRTKSGRLIERIIFMSEEDYQAFKAGGGGKAAADILKKYLTKEEAGGLEKWDKDEVKAIKTFIRTKSGKLVERLVYVSKEDYERIKQGGSDARDILKKYVVTKPGEKIDGWGEAEMKTIKTYVRTKSGRLIEKTIMVSKEDYERLQEITRKGGDPASILGKYMAVGEGEKIESWQKPEPKPMKVVKTYIRTKSGKLVEKTILMTEEEYRQFQESGGDINFLKKFIPLAKGETIEDWEKASTVYAASDDDEEIQAAKPGTRIIGKDGEIYEIVVDPITGKKFKKKVGGGKGGVGGGGGDSDIDSGVGSMKDRTTGKSTSMGRKTYEDITEEEMYEALDPVEREKLKKYKAMKAGKRNEGSDSDYSYRSVVSAGGTRHVRRKKKLGDGKYADSESFHSSQDEEGQERRRKRRRERKHGAGSAHSYYSVVSEGGTRHVRRRKRNADGTRGDSESYHSSESEYMAHLAKKGKKKAAKTKKKKEKKRREHGSDSEYSYYSDVTEGGTHVRKRKKRLRDAQGNVIGHAGSEAYTSPSDSDSDEDSSDAYTFESMSDGKGGRIRVKKLKPESERKKGKKGKGGKGEKDARNRKGPGGHREVISPDSTAFSDVSTDEEEVQRKLANMTEEEKKIYLAERAKRQKEREEKRREKYGDKYEEMVAKAERNKKRAKERKEKEKYQSMVDYGKGAGRGLGPDGQPLDGREPGMGHDEWGGKGKGKKGRKYKDGNEADDESEDGDYVIGSDGKLRKKKKGAHGDDDDSGSDVSVEIIRDKDGNIIKRIVRKKGGKGGNDEEYDIEYEYDAEGNLIGTKKVKKIKGKDGKYYRKGEPGAPESDEESDGDYFEVDEHGNVKLKEGKKKIDISKLTDDDLRRLGIDPTLSKKEITRLLKEKFGDDIKITEKGKTIGIKPIDAYGSDVDTDDLADDSDLDTDTLRGTRRTNVLMRKGGQKILDHIKNVINWSKITDQDYAKDLDERDSGIDYLHHYRLVETNKIEMYAKSFCVEDQDYDAVIANNETRLGLDGIPTLQAIEPKQLEYCLRVLKIDENTQVTFRMFAVVTALCERVTKMDDVSRHLLEICNLADIERKMDLYRSMFYTNVTSDRDPNYITAESLRIELIAGGLSWEQQEYIMDRLCPNLFGEVSFLDYILYIPLFLSMHDNICDDPLDMSDQKYMSFRKKSGTGRQRDMNPLGNPLKRSSAWLTRNKAKDLLEGKLDAIEEVKKENLEMLSKRDKLPHLLNN